MNVRITTIGCMLWAAVAVACGGTEAVDGGPRPDSGPADAGDRQDAAPNPDASDPPADAGTPDSGDQADAGEMDAGGFVPPAFGSWVKFEPPGAECSDGSPYKFFVNFSRTSSDVVVFLEGGGACWDYASCTGTGVRSAANRDGLPDDHATQHANLNGLPIPVDVIYPLLNADPQVSPMHDWNKVFIPYCTGDVYSGDRTVTYVDPDGVEPPVEFKHVGHRNILRTIDTLSEMFPAIPRMLLSGCSAGGAGAVINYHFFRSGLNIDTGYLLDDSGPIFPDTATSSWSRPLHERVRTSWNVDPLLASAPGSAALMMDFGNLGEVLALEYPTDRLAHTHFRLDYNYSLYSYERFYQVGKGGVEPLGDGMGLGGLGLDETVPADRSAVYGLWWDDTQLLRAQFDQHDNLGYFMPFYRDTNSSHCLTIPGIGEYPQDELLNAFLNDFDTLAWKGTELPVEGGTMNIREYVEHLLDDATPLTSYFEADGEGRYLSCVPDERYYDEAMCVAAHD